MFVVRGFAIGFFGFWCLCVLRVRGADVFGEVTNISLEDIFQFDVHVFVRND